MKFSFSIDGEKREIEIIDKEGEYEFRRGDIRKTYSIHKLWGRNILIKDENNKVYNVFVEKHEDGHCVFFKGRSFTVRDATSRKKGIGFDMEGKVTIRSPLPGQIRKVFKKAGDEVEAGDSILVLEAMKMENEIKSPKKGVIKSILVKESGSVDPNTELFTVE